MDRIKWIISKYFGNTSQAFHVLPLTLSKQGRTMPTYKIALGKTLLSLANSGQTSVPWEINVNSLPTLKEQNKIKF